MYQTQPNPPENYQETASKGQMYYDSIMSNVMIELTTWNKDAYLESLQALSASQLDSEKSKIDNAKEEYKRINQEVLATLSKEEREELKEEERNAVLKDQATLEELEGELDSLFDNK